MPTRGDLTEAAVLNAFLRLGWQVCVPWSHDSAFDLVVSPDGEQFLRVQCKSGRHEDGCVIFNSASTDHGQGNRTYVGLADVFAVYCPALDRVFVVPVERAATRSTRLRLRPSRNGQVRGINNAEDYAVERWAAELAVSRVLSMSVSRAPRSSAAGPSRSGRGPCRSAWSGMSGWCGTCRSRRRSRSGPWFG